MTTADAMHQEFSGRHQKHFSISEFYRVDTVIAEVYADIARSFFKSISPCYLSIKESFNKNLLWYIVRLTGALYNIFLSLWRCHMLLKVLTTRLLSGRYAQVWLHCVMRVLEAVYSVARSRMPIVYEWFYRRQVAAEYKRIFLHYTIIHLKDVLTILFWIAISQL